MEDKVRQSESFSKAIDLYLRKPISDTAYEAIQSPSTSENIFRDKFFRHVTNVLGPISFNPNDIARREAFKLLYVETPLPAGTESAKAAPPCVDGFKNMLDAIFDRNADLIFLIGKRGSGKTIAINNLLTTYWDRFQDKRWIVFRGDVAKLIDNLANRERYPHPVSILNFTIAHAFYVMLKNHAQDKLLTPLFRSRSPFLQFLDNIPPGASKRPAGSRAKTVGTFWRYIVRTYKSKAKEADIPGDTFSIELALEMEEKWPGGLREVYQYVVQYLKSEQGGNADVLLIVDGVDNIKPGIGSSTYKRLIQELGYCLPHGEENPWYSKILVALRANTKFDLINHIEANALKQPGHGSVEFLMSQQNIAHIVLKRIAEVVAPNTKWARRLVQRLPQIEQSSLGEHSWLLTEVTSAILKHAKLVGLVVGRSGNDSKNSRDNLNEAFVSLFNQNLRSLIRNVFLSYQYLLKNFPPTSADRAHPKSYINAHRRYIVEASILGGHQVFSANSDSNIHGRWCPNLFEWTPDSSHSSWNGLTLLRVLQLVRACPSTLGYVTVIDKLNHDFGYARKTVKEALDWSLDFGLIEHSALVWVELPDGIDKCPSLKICEKGSFIMMLPFRSLPVAYFMGVVCRLGAAALTAAGTRDDLHHRNSGRQRRFRAPALNTALLLMRHVVCAHEREMGTFLGRDTAIYALSSLNSFRREAVRFFELLNEEERHSINSHIRAVIGTAAERTGMNTAPAVASPTVRNESSTSLGKTQPPTEERIATQGKRFLVFATEWQSAQGGLSTLNRALCCALAAKGHTVVCVLPSHVGADWHSAHERSVTLVSPSVPPGTDASSAMLRKLALPIGFSPDVVIGHGRITGPYAKVCVEDSFPNAKRLHVVHMSPGDIEIHKANTDAGERADAREKVERDLCEDAHTVIAIGPRLLRSFENLLSTRASKIRVLRLDPPIEIRDTAVLSAEVNCLVLGRAADVDDVTLKGLDIAAAAMGLVALDSRFAAKPPKLVVRGAAAHRSAALNQELKTFANSPYLDISVKPFSTSTDLISHEICRSSLLLMPSRSEGFGLVALEAIAHGVPVLVSNKSGFAEFILEAADSLAAPFIVRTSDDIHVSAINWRDSIINVLQDVPSARARAIAIREALVQHSSWSSAIDTVVSGF